MVFLEYEFFDISMWQWHLETSQRIDPLPLGYKTSLVGPERER